MKKYHLGFRCLLAFIISLTLTKGISGQTRSQLEKERNDIINQIEVANQQVNLAEKNTKNTLGELNAISAQITSRESLILNLKNQMELSFTSLQTNQDSLTKVNTKLSSINEDYNQTMRLAYIKQKLTNKWISFFSAKSINEGILAWRYALQLQQYIKAKRNEVNGIKEVIHLKNSSLEEEQLYTNKLLEQEKENFEKLAVAKKKKANILKDLKSKESELKKERKQKQRERERLNNKIEQIILAELAERNKIRKDNSSHSSSFAKLNSVIWPVINGYVVSKFGDQAHPTIRSLKITNNGIDISSTPNSEIMTVADGTVVGITKIPGFNTMIIIEHGGYYTVYSKLEKSKVTKGQKVLQGNTIGILSSEGNLHFELWKGKEKIDPEKWLKKR